MSETVANGPAARRNKKIVGTQGTVKVVMVALALLAQLGLLYYLVDTLRSHTLYLYFLLEVLGAVTITFVVARNRSSAYTIVWLIIMMAMPVFGYILFLLWGTTGLTHRKSHRIRSSIQYSNYFVEQDPGVYQDFLQKHPAQQRLCTYLIKEGFPIYDHTQATYHPLGEDQFEQLIIDLEQARRFVFIEYFIIAEGHIWDRIHSILRRKAQEGVDVRILMDELGSITKISNSFVRELRREGIKVMMFNPLHSNIFRMFINYRNHQKITVIDGNIGYTGGTNIADEYVNLDKKLGHWKDTAIRLEGQAVWGLTVTFLQMWDSEYDSRSDYPHYRPTLRIPAPGFYQPFADGPVNNPSNPAEEVFLQIIAQAHQYVWITTPYLVIDHSMQDILCMAAKGGIDVRIVTPRLWDHWYVHMVTRSNYGVLMEAGVKIYEYTPGFIHAKIILSDDDSAVIGSINMDYRSFFLHFENGVWISGAPVLQDIKKDMLDIFAVSEEMSLPDWKNRPRHTKFVQGVLRVFAPLF
ncbi:MAG: cardiolipin synthase [Syntrophomonadaceae bacterium]